MNIERFFQKMVSNTLAGSSCQTMFRPENANQEYVGRVFYKIFAGGEYYYSFLFSGATDSSFPVANKTSADYYLTDWEITFARVGKCKLCNMETFEGITDFKRLTFEGKESIKVSAPTLFCSDKIKLSFEKDDYLCLEIGYKGREIPHHYENSIPAFVKTNEGWTACNQAVFASMIGCDRKVEKRIAYLGDSITQGLGAGDNEYKHWNAVLSEKLGDKYAYWNLGIGYGMANDCAKDKLWLFKARQNDIVVVCYGVNDMFRVNDLATTKKDYLKIATELKASGCTVIFQTIPPFDFSPVGVTMFRELNSYIKTEIASIVDGIFDISPILTQDLEEGQAKFGGHPNQEGCKLWAEAIYPLMKEIVEK